MDSLGTLTRNLLFTGKGGVGKTSIACATAVLQAENGRRVLLVSTDTASNLDEVLETRLTTQPTRVEKVSGLWAMNIDPEKSAREYRERVVGPYRNLLPESAVKSIEEQLSGACTIEIAAFDEFAKLLGMRKRRQVSTSPNPVAGRAARRSGRAREALGRTRRPLMS